MKKCTKCKKEKALSSFNKRSSAKSGYASWCKACHKAWDSNYYSKNKKLFSKRRRANKFKFYSEIQAIKESTPCADCHLFYPACVMDFDHLDPKTKSFSIGSATYNYTHSLSKIKEEIAKCELVCANCHRLRTFKRRRWGVA